MTRARRFAVALGAASLAATAACSLLVDSGDLTGAGETIAASGDDSSSPIAADTGDDDASTPIDGTSGVDADAGVSPCTVVDPTRIYCEDFDNAYDVTNMHCMAGSVALETTNPSSPPSALLYDMAATGYCNAVIVLGTVTNGAELTFKVRFDSLSSRVHLFNLSVASEDERRFLFLNVFPARIALGVATPADGGTIAYAEPRVRVATTPIGKWIDVKLVVDELTTGGRATLTFDGQIVDQPLLLETWGAGSVRLRAGISVSEKANRLALDDVAIRRLP